MILKRGKKVVIPLQGDIVEIDELFKNIKHRLNNFTIRRRIKGSDKMVSFSPKSDLYLSEMGMHWKNINEDSSNCEINKNYMNLYVDGKLVAFTSLQINPKPVFGALDYNFRCLHDILMDFKSDFKVCFMTGDKYSGSYNYELKLDGVTRFKFKNLKEVKAFLKWFKPSNLGELSGGHIYKKDMTFDIASSAFGYELRGFCKWRTLSLD